MAAGEGGLFQLIARVFTTGSGVWPRRRNTASSGHSSGVWTGSTISSEAAGDAVRTAGGVGVADRREQRCLFRAPPVQRLHARRGPPVVPECGDHAAPRKQHGPGPLLSRYLGAWTTTGGGRAAAVERRFRRPRRLVPAAEQVRHQRAAAQPALSRRADAARAPPRRLHRQLERRPHRAGLPPGRARCPPRDCVAGDAGIRRRSAFSARASDRASRC